MGVTDTYYGNKKSAGPGIFLRQFADLRLVDVRRFVKYRIYLAAPLFLDAQRIYNSNLFDILTSRYYMANLTQNFEENGCS